MFQDQRKYALIVTIYQALLLPAPLKKDSIRPQNLRISLPRKEREADRRV